MSGKPILGYWNIRGFAQQIRLELTYLKVDFEDKQYPFGPAPDYSKEAWLNDKETLGLEFPNLPYYLDGDAKVTESKAILKYIARTRGPALVPSTPEGLAKADMVEGVAHDVQRQLVTLTYAPAGTADTLAVDLAPKFQQLNAYLTKNKYAAGDKISYEDFFLYEVLHQFQRYSSEFLKPYPALEKYIQDFEALPELAEYIKANENLPSYSPFAPLQY